MELQFSYPGFPEALLPELNRHREMVRQSEDRKRAQAQKITVERDYATEQKLAMAQREIDHYTPELERLKAREHELDLKVWHFENRGLPCGGYRKELERIREKVFRMETKVLNAEYKKEAALRAGA